MASAAALHPLTHAKKTELHTETPSDPHDRQGQRVARGEGEHTIRAQIGGSAAHSIDLMHAEGERCYARKSPGLVLAKIGVSGADFSLKVMWYGTWDSSQNLHNIIVNIHIVMQMFWRRERDSNPPPLRCRSTAYSESTAGESPVITVNPHICHWICH